MEFPVLETDRLELVQVMQEYAEQFFEIFSNDKVIQYYGMDRLETIDQAREVIDSFQKSFESKRGIRWAMVLKESGEFLGTLGLNNLNIAGKRAEIGYELHPSYWRKGLTSEAVDAVLRYSFSELSLFRIGAVTYPQNEASSNLLKRLGFTQEGLLRGYLYQNGQNHDALIFSLLRTDCMKGED